MLAVFIQCSMHMVCCLGGGWGRRLDSPLLHAQARDVGRPEELVGLLNDFLTVGLHKCGRRAIGNDEKRPARFSPANGERAAQIRQTASGNVRPVVIQHRYAAPEFLAERFEDTCHGPSGRRRRSILWLAAMVLQIQPDPAAYFVQIRFLLWRLVVHSPTIAHKMKGVQSRLMKSSQEITVMRTALLSWYRQGGRTLPWRIRPEDRAAGLVANPYKVWLSEIMCQQTTTTAVIPYWRKFLFLWPDVQALAAAPRDDVLAAWAGLGYYARARNLHACARRICADYGGIFPKTEAELQKLPGIGPYTAAAMAAICNHEPANVVDGNVERVISRIFRVQTELPKARPELRRLAADLADPDFPGDYAQALMDVGALLCKPKTPNCPTCPWQEFCQAALNGDMSVYPKRAPKAKRSVRYGAVFYVVDEDRIWLRTRPEKGLLGGMLELPGTAWEEERLDESVYLAQAPCPGNWQKCEGMVRHVFTHFTLFLNVYKGQGSRADFDVSARLEKLDSYALPGLMHKAIRLARDL